EADQFQRGPRAEVAGVTHAEFPFDLLVGEGVALVEPTREGDLVDLAVAVAVPGQPPVHAQAATSRRGLVGACRVGEAVAALGVHEGVDQRRAEAVQPDAGPLAGAVVYAAAHAGAHLPGPAAGAAAGAF